MGSFQLPESRVRPCHTSSSPRRYLETELVNSQKDRSIYRICLWHFVSSLHSYQSEHIHLIPILISSSACVGASLRIYAGAQYLASDDSTYIIATITMACWTEMVLLFVVACVPSLPRVAIRLGFPKVVSSLVSCALSYSGVNNLTKRMATSRTQPGNEPAAGRNSTYHELEDYSRTTLTLARDGRGEVDSMFPPQAHLPPPEGQIIRTTHITATEDYNTPNNDASLSSYQHQHPWTAQDWPREERQIV